jgi:hypothetical protein
MMHVVKASAGAPRSDYGGRSRSNYDWQDHSIVNGLDS